MQADYAAAGARKVRDWMPDFAAFAQYEWARGQHVRLSGLVRTLSYRDVDAGRNHNVAGWGIQLSSVAHPLPPLTTYLTFNYGRGYASLGGDLLMGNYDLTAVAGSPGRMYAPSRGDGAPASSTISAPISSPRSSAARRATARAVLSTQASIARATCWQPTCSG